MRLSTILQEKLGDKLESLKAGKMLDVFKQRVYNFRNGSATTDPGNSFIHQGMGQNVTISDEFQFSSAKEFRSLAKKFSKKIDQYEQGAVIYAKGKAIIAVAGSFESINNALIVTSDFKDVFDIKELKAVKYSFEFNKDIEQPGGAPYDVRGFSSILDRISFLAEKENISLSVKFIGPDDTRRKLMVDRSANRRDIPVKDEDFLKGELKTRLAKYKNSKVRTIDSEEDLLDELNMGGVLEKFTYKGVTYTNITDTFKETNSIVSLLKGGTVKVSYKQDEKLGWKSITVTYKLNGTVLKAVKVS